MVELPSVSSTSTPNFAASAAASASGVDAATVFVRPLEAEQDGTELQAVAVAELGGTFELFSVEERTVAAAEVFQHDAVIG